MWFIKFIWWWRSRFFCMRVKHWNVTINICWYFNPLECRICHDFGVILDVSFDDLRNIWVTSSSYSLNLIIFELIKFIFILGSIWKHCNTHIKGNWFPRQIWKFCQRSLCHWSWICSEVKVSITKLIVWLEGGGNMKKDPRLNEICWIYLVVNLNWLFSVGQWMHCWLILSNKTQLHLQAYSHVLI